jgi:transcriptional regulator with AAA-type ATPase domain
LQALEQACDLINYFHTQLHQVKSQKEFKINQTTTLLRSSLPGNIRQLEPNRIGMGLVNKPLLPSVRYNTVNIEKNINDEIKYQQSTHSPPHSPTHSPPHSPTHSSTLSPTHSPPLT